LCKAIDFAASLKSERDGDIDVAGAELANVLSAAGLVEEYRLYFRPYMLGTGKPYCAGPRLPLRLMKLDAIGGRIHTPGGLVLNQ
jgi:hypothetical protein